MLFFVVVPVCVVQGFRLVVGSSRRKPSSIVAANEDFLSRRQNIGRVPQNSNRIGARPTEIHVFAPQEAKIKKKLARVPPSQNVEWVEQDCRFIKK